MLGRLLWLVVRTFVFSRYLNRTATHPVLQVDPDFREFLEREGDLPKATSTSALSGAGVMRLFHRVGDVVEKISFKMDESDEVGLCQPITFLPPVSVCPFYIKPHGIFFFCLHLLLSLETNFTV